MSLELNLISSFKVKGKPGYDSILSNIQNWSKKLVENLQMDNNNLTVFCIQGLFDYRTGLIGLILNLIGYHFFKYISPVNTIKSSSTEYEVILFLLCISTRVVPINNIWNFNAKNFINNRFYTDGNLSEPGIFDLKSLLLLEPVFDSGCMIYSNKNPTKSGFEKIPNIDIYSNRGVTWSYFENDNKGIMIMNIDFETINDGDSLLIIKKLVEIKNEFEFKNTTLIEEYETYIIGNFNVYFNMRGVIPDINIIYNILDGANICIVSNNQEPTCTEFIMYSKYKNENENIFDYYEKDNVYTIKNIKESCLTSYNPVFGRELTNQIVLSIKESHFEIDDNCSVEIEEGWENI